MMAKRVETASEIDEFEKLLREYGNTSFNCGDHRGPRKEYKVLLRKVYAAERAIMEWVEKRVAVVH
jgi:hypothetical protein